MRPIIGSVWKPRRLRHRSPGFRHQSVSSVEETRWDEPETTRAAASEFMAVAAQHGHGLAAVLEVFELAPRLR